jgi:diacylglycerol kinase (ATP)
MRYLVIVNPRSGSQNHARKLKAVIGYFDRHGLDLDVRFTERRGHATELAREACASYDVIIGAGGDGTINEVLNGMAGSGRKMAIIPWGTGNVFSLEMNFPKTLTGICRMIRRGESLRLDTAACDGRRFLLMCGAGFDAYSLKQLENLDVKRTAGKLAYVIGGMRAFERYSYPEMEVELPDGRTERCRYALVSNTSRYGAYFTVSPGANPADGLLDVFLYNESGKLNMLRLIFRVFLSAFGLNALQLPSPFLSKIATYRVDGLRLSSTGAVFTQIDGEFAGRLPVEVRVIPHSLDCVLPRKTIRRILSMGAKPPA